MIGVIRVHYHVNCQRRSDKVSGCQSGFEKGRHIHGAAIIVSKAAGLAMSRASRGRVGSMGNEVGGTT